jgi:hypothetical protein
MREILCVAAALSASLATLMFTAAASADGGFADPPGGRAAVATDDFGRGFSSARFDDPELSVVRFLVGPGARVGESGAAAGLLAAMEIGRGPALGRLSAGFFDVGDEDGVAQYVAELGVDFGGRSAFRPVIAAGGGLAHTSSRVTPDGAIDTSEGALLGVGVVRAGLGYRLPFDGTDARVILDVTGTFPAIRASDAPELSPWLLSTLAVGIGF